MIEVNRHVTDFLTNLPDVFAGVHKMNRYGFCHPASRGYVGLVSVERKIRRREEAKRRKRRQEDDAKMRQLFPAYQPHKRRLTREEKDERFLMRVEYRRLRDEGGLSEHLPRRWFRRPAPARSAR